MNRRYEIAGILTLALSLLVLTSLLGYNPNEEPSISQYVKIENPMGIVGVAIGFGLIKIALGYSALVLPLLGLIWGWWLFSRKPLVSLARHSLYFMAGLLWLTISLGAGKLWFFSASHRAVL
ncbi:MAG: DNA translocase FtsK 4TM domain-containing protein, partial [Fidelibacterota bacterium]